MKEWFRASKEEIRQMTMEEACKIIQEQIDLGHTEEKVLFKPREHLTHAYEMVLERMKVLELCLEALYSLAYEVASYKYPRQYDYSEEQIEEILLCAGLNKELLEQCR